RTNTAEPRQLERASSSKPIDAAYSRRSIWVLNASSSGSAIATRPSRCRHRAPARPSAVRSSGHDPADDLQLVHPFIPPAHAAGASRHIRTTLAAPPEKKSPLRGAAEQGKDQNNHHPHMLSPCAGRAIPAM